MAELTCVLGMDKWHHVCWHGRMGKLSNDKKYWEFLYAIGEKNGWKTGPGTYFADDLCVAQVYQQLYEQYKEPKMIEPSR